MEEGRKEGREADSEEGREGERKVEKDSYNFLLPK